MNSVFISKICLDKKTWLMQAETEDFFVELETVNMQRSHPKSFALYEEYSRRNIDETIRARRENFDKADSDAKRRLAKEVEREIKNFLIWLKETKELDHTTAHYYSIGLKSLLLGLPVGAQVASLFDTILNARTTE